MVVSEFRRSVCIPEMALNNRVPARTRHYAESVSSRLRVLTIATCLAAAVSGGFGVFQLVLGGPMWRFGFVNLGSAALFLLVPLLYRFGELIAPLAFFLFAYVSVSTMCFAVGTGSGLQFYFIVAASLAVLVLGIERTVLAGTLTALAVAAAIVLEVLVPNDRGLGPPWALTAGFVLSAVSAGVMVFATVWLSLREMARAEEAMEAEYQRSEQLLANILPATIAQRLKEPSRTIIADKYDDASILFADIAGYTERASDITPTELVRFLDRLYTDLDALVDRHGLEKVKTSGDSYMVVAGVPKPRADHSPAWPSIWPKPSPTSRIRGAGRCRCASALPPGPWWPGWSGPASSSTTSGVMRSTSPHAWRPQMWPDEFRCRTTCMSASVTISCSRSAAMSTSRAKV